MSFYIGPLLLLGQYKWEIWLIFNLITTVMIGALVLAKLDNTN